MAIWNDRTLIEYCNHSALVTPYDPALVNPASIDLRLGASYRLPDLGWSLRSVTVNTQWCEALTMPVDGIELPPGAFILCCTLETVAIPRHASAALYSKSSTGRIGLEHLHAGWIDPGFCGQLTLEFKNVAPWPILLVPGRRYMQMVVYDLVEPPARDYSQTGRYQNQQGATPAKEVQP